MVQCWCGQTAVVRTSWTNQNPGRRFYGCCDFIDWYDPPMCARSVSIIPSLLRARNAIQATLDDTRREAAKMKKYLILSWMQSMVFAYLNPSEWNFKVLLT
ncbi:zinc finger, GRF-type [Artemisia annua]|uniref:Zinc finger, GRF-type n=1 Tax=Artemisia annua TaxID=35608 RepID=A0A2U1NLJ8_ARTAN|nr:zinc finger, GRF-type [Artemisia annua]